MEMHEQGAGKRHQVESGQAGAERSEPGQSTRTVEPGARGEIADIARQQGTSQRGYTGDNPGQYETPATPGSKVTGDPGRASRGTESIGGEHSQASIRRVGKDEGKGSQGFGNE
jgi:hypothetical protein